MDQSTWFERVNRSLRRSGLPARYVSRTCDELLDHACEQQRTVADTEAKLLGDCPDALAAVIVKNYRRGSIMRRIPVLLLWPIPFLLALFVPLAWFAGGFLILERMCDLPDQPATLDVSQHWIVLSFFHAGLMLIPLASSWLLTVLSRQIARPWFWSATLFAMLLAGTMLTQTSLNLSSDPDLSLTIGTDANDNAIANLLHQGQCSLVALTGLFHAKQQRDFQLV